MKMLNKIKNSNLFRSFIIFSIFRFFYGFIVLFISYFFTTEYEDGIYYTLLFLLISVVQVFMNFDNDFTGPINLGNPDEFSILELAQKVIDLTGSKSKLVFKELPEDDPKQRQPDIMLAKEKLHWEPKIKLSDGLTHTIEYFKKIL